ncbi:MAG: TonB-dependent receptor [Gammaproteobacteria bacterium]|nr:MAG: TonB-dependent receptor [Gammaproteobacteria bacterium]
MLCLTILGEDDMTLPGASLAHHVHSLITKVVIPAGVFAVAAIAWPAYGQEQGIEEITVTARYREQNLQETPLAISAFSGDLLEDRGAADTADIEMFVPNAVIAPLGAGWGSTMAAFVRGIGLNDNILSYEPGVPIYIDDVYLGRNQGAILDLLDLERVEVLRGPQGTLFGKNAVGGAVRFISSKPQGGGGNISITVGERDRLNVRGMLDVEVVPDVLLARFSGSSKTQDGYFDILDYECVNGPGSLGGGGTGVPPIPGLGFPGLSIDLGSAVNESGNCVVDELGNENVQSGRAMFLWHASPEIDVTLSADVTHQHQKGPADKYVRFYRPGTPEAGLSEFWNFAVGVPIFGVAWDDRFLTDSPYTNYNRYVDPVSGRTFPNVNDVDEYGIAGAVEWQISPELNIKSITAYREFKNSFGRTSSGSPIPLDLTWDVTRHDQLTQEFQFTGRAFDRLDWTAGFFYYTADDSNYQSGSLFPGVIYQQDSHDTQDATNWAVFVHGVYDITDQLALTAGIRYTDDEKNAYISRHNFDGTDRLPVPGFTTQTSPGLVPIAETNWSPTVGLDYQVNDNLLLFAFYSTGFRGGGFSPRPANGLQLANFLSENLDNYEGGFKSEWFEHRLRLNTNVFFSIYSDQQVFRGDLPDASGAQWFHQINSGESEYWGVEVEAQANPIENLMIDSTLGYIHHELTDPGFSGQCVEFANGDPCYSTRTPEFTFAIGGSYEFNLGDRGTLTPRIDARYQSKIYFLPYTADLGNNVASNPIEGVQEGYTVVNGRITWVSPSTDWDVQLYAVNLTDKVYFNGKLPLIGIGLGREQGNVAPPREFGVTVTRHF